jgi:uncharacterized protein YndB with AHSA1/START domain
MTSTPILHATKLCTASTPPRVFDGLTDPQLYLRWMRHSTRSEPVLVGLFRVDINSKNVARAST